MRLLIDTHTLFWSVEEPTKVSASAMLAIQPLTSELLLSAAPYGNCRLRWAKEKSGCRCHTDCG